MDSFGVTKPALFIAWKHYQSARAEGMTPKQALEKSQPGDVNIGVLACFGLEAISDNMEDILYGK